MNRMKWDEAAFVLWRLSQAPNPEIQFMTKAADAGVLFTQAPKVRLIKT